MSFIDIIVHFCFLHVHCMYTIFIMTCVWYSTGDKGLSTDECCRLNNSAKS